MKDFKINGSKKVVISSSSEETFLFGKSIGETCVGGETFLLFGDLGAGKTVLTQGIASGLNCRDKINSPTFNILKIYKIKNKRPNKIKSFCHIDAYRLNSGQDLINLGIEEFVNSLETVTVIEWAEKVDSAWPLKAIKIGMKNISENERKIMFL